MKTILKEYLFEKEILVQNRISEHPVEAMLAIARLFNVQIVSGLEYVHEDLIPFLSDRFGRFVPDPFYRGFPRSVIQMAPEELWLDQLLHYTETYGWGNFSQAGYSLLEENFVRSAFKENTEIHKFSILTEEAAKEKLKEYIDDMLKASRPLSDSNYQVLLTYVQEYQYPIEQCVCKNTAIRLLIDTRDLRYAGFLWLADVIKVVDLLNYSSYGNQNIKKLNLKNQDRKFISSIIDVMFENKTVRLPECFEKKAVWCGLLHHIHYRAKTPGAEHFVNLMRGKTNQSAYSEFERAMAEGNIQLAVMSLGWEKGSGALLRNLNYIVSRCKTESEIAFALDAIDAKNPIILLQLLMQYGNYANRGSRVFKFTRYNQLCIHKESEEELSRRKSVLSPEQVALLTQKIGEKLKQLLHGRLGKVYISPEMYNIAIPLQENTSIGGYGVLPKGSRIPLEKGKKIRAFTYWEKVNDIDLSAIGICENGEQEEFSWQTMYENQFEELCYSGDQTSGYDGGSEYFDLDPELFRQKHPDIKYLIFCDNVYSFSTFRSCICRAGYMLRDIDDSGEVFEPQTVKSSFTVNCDSTFAYLFGVDLTTNEFIWLNAARAGNVHVAGTTELDFLLPYFNATSIINVGSLLKMMATEVVEFSEDADFIASDQNLEVKNGVQLIRSCDFEKISSLLS